MAEVNKNFLDDLILVAKEFFSLTISELDPYTTRKSVIEVEPGKIVLLTPSHIQFAKYGRGPGKNPPLDPILAWVGDKGIIFDGTDERGTAFAIQAKIGREGTNNWVPGAPNALEEALNKNFERYSKEMGDLMAVKVSDEVNKIYVDILPPGKFEI